MNLFRRIGRRVEGGLAVAVVLLSAGCVSPPSVAPLLRVVEKAMADEARLIEEDRVRNTVQVDQSRRALADAFEADLRQKPGADAEWVLEATGVYVAAREALVRHEARLDQQSRQRIDNLRAAAEAQRRALGLLEQQDRLITRVVGVDLWRVLNPEEQKP